MQVLSGVLKKVMEWSPPGRRKRGRPKLTWAEEIRRLMEEKGLMEEDWNDRDKWKKIIQGLSKRFERFKFGIFYVLIVKIRYNFTHK